MEPNRAFVFDNTTKYIELGYNIAYYRKHAGLTQELSISRQYIGAIEALNILRPVSLDLLFNIVTVLEIDVTKLLTFRE